MCTDEYNVEIYLELEMFSLTKRSNKEWIEK